MIDDKVHKKMKVLFFIEQNSVSYKYFENIFIELKKYTNVEVEVFNLIRDEEVNRHLGQFCSRVQTFTNKEPYKKQIFFIKKMIRQVKPDIIHAHEVIPSFYAALGLMISFSRVKLIFHRHHSFYRNKATEFMERLAFLRCNIAISVSKAQQEAALKEHPLKKNKIIQVYNGITVTDNGQPLPVDMHQYKDNYKIVLLARLRSRKGHDTAIAAIDIVRKRIPGIVLFFAGEGEFRKDIQQMVIEKGVQKNVVLLGDVKNIRPLLNEMHISILPSESEAFNLSVLETFACSRLSIASNLPSIMECITDGKTGVLVTPGNAGELAEKIIYYLENETARNTIAANGYQLYNREFTTAAMVNKLTKVYSNLIAGS